MVSVEGFCCCIGAAILYVTGRSFEGSAVELESVTRVSKLKDLATLWDAATTVFPLVVAVSGWVRSDTPIKCKYTDGKGVIVKKTEKCLYLKRIEKKEGEDKDKDKEGGNDKKDKTKEDWEKVSKLLSSNCNEVPWYLGDDTGRARVLGARGASKFELKYGGEVFEKSTQTPEQDKLDLEKGIKMLGIKKIEYYLPVGRFLTVIGEVTKDGDGTFCIQKPDRGRPFYVSCETISELIDNLRSLSSFFKYASVVVGVVGVCLVLFHETPDDKIKPPKREYERKPRPPPAGAAAKEAPKSKDERKRDNYEEADQCRVCFQSKYNSVFTPCGHMCCCMGCASRLTKCPICRGHVDRVVRTFSP